MTEFSKYGKIVAQREVEARRKRVLGVLKFAQKRLEIHLSKNTHADRGQLQGLEAIHEQLAYLDKLLPTYPICKHDKHFRFQDDGVACMKCMIWWSLDLEFKGYAANFHNARVGFPPPEGWYEKYVQEQANKLDENEVLASLEDILNGNDSSADN